MGMASKNEQDEFERLCKHYPELEKARMEFEINLEKQALANAIAPPAFLKDRIMNRIRQEIPGQNGARIIVSENFRPPVKKIGGMRWAIAVSVLLMLGCGLFVYIMHQKAQYYKKETAKAKDAMDKMKEKGRELEEKIEQGKERIQQVKLVNPQKNIPSDVSIFWDSTTANVYLIIKDLNPLPTGLKYQVWSVTKGKYQSLGLFDAPLNGERLILQVNNAQEAESFAITIEKSGNLSEPVNDLPEKRSK